MQKDARSHGCRVKVVYLLATKSYIFNNEKHTHVQPKLRQQKPDDVVMKEVKHVATAFATKVGAHGKQSFVRLHGSQCFVTFSDTSFSLVMLKLLEWIRTSASLIAFTRIYILHNARTK